MVLQLDDAISPFLNVFKDGRLVDSICLDGRDSIVLGRHTNSDVLLTHPSISRHHLEIQLLHATRELLLTDMGSVHGTWIDGKRLPGTPVTAKEGEAIKLGASSRTYRVQWLPHPLPASSNKRLTNMKEEADSELSNTRRMVLMQACSTKSIETCTERNRTGPWEPANKSNDLCNENSRTEQFPLQIPKLERCPSPCLKREAMSPHMVQEISVAARSANGIETFNANINLHISQQQQQQHKGGLPPLPPASRRIPFAPLQSNTITPIVKKRIPSTHKRLVSWDSMKSTNKQVMEGENLDSGSKLRFQHCDSAPSPILDTTISALQSSALSSLAEKRFTQALTTCNVNTITSEVPSAQRPLSIKTPKSNIDEKLNQIIKPRENLQQLSDGENTERQLVINLQDKGENEGSDQGGRTDLVGFLSRCSSLDESTIAEEDASDKENQGPVFDVGKQSTGGVFNSLQAGSCAGDFSAATELSRRPFQPLILTPNGVYRSGSPGSSTYAQEDSVLARLHTRPSSVVQNLDHMLPKLKGLAKSETRREWHIVIDTTCLMDPNSFKVLKLLEGIREVRLIIPQIVIRELDFCKRRDKTCMSPNAVLKWIESCMVKFPSWIHVQNSSENMRVGVTTPPASPCHVHPASLIYGGTFGDLMSPTTGDHVLNCALVFSTAVFDGEVALLTNDTALKIKAMAEGILCESTTTFCGSLLSPYSERFLWAGSIAHGAQKSYHSTPEFPIRIFAEPKRTIISAARGMTSKKHQVLEGLKNHCKQAQGLKVILNY